MRLSQSEKLFSEAQAIIPGAVNSPVRAWRAVGGTPRFILSARGAEIVDVDGNTYIDFVSSWGAMIAGHAHPEVIRAVAETAKRGTSFGAPTAREIELARRVQKAFPSVEMLRLVSSGTEATMSAVRLARAVTGREKIVKFAGCYHGHSDGLLVRAGSGALTFGVPDSPGVPDGVAELTLVAEFNDLAQVEAYLDADGDSIAALLVEPVPANMGVVPPAEGFLARLRELTSSRGILLIFDEVISGFRLAYGGVQELLGVEADITCLGKILGGGLPLAGFGGKREVMSQLAPQGPVYQAGTLSGNPLAVAAGLATLDLLNKGTYEQLESLGEAAEGGLRKALVDSGLKGCVQRVGSMLTIFFGVSDVSSFSLARGCDLDLFARYFQGMLERGIYIAPSQFEAVFISVAHSPEHIEQLVHAATEVLGSLARVE